MAVYSSVKRYRDCTKAQLVQLAEVLEEQRDKALAERDRLAAKADRLVNAVAKARAERDRYRDELTRGRAGGHFETTERLAELALKEAAYDQVREIAFDPEVISALEHGAVGTPPNIDGINKDEAIGYGRDALRDIRRVLDEEATDAPM